ncbi:hypothetical protein KGV31_002172 [Vibrio parahaemolyticus]|nr:hypothetical protein [Vibrio parahaemolyticus]EHU0344315.1 hypothetical protein [Vibrio parahaemolyticus]EHU0354349.1 hypothetical protein [Vibrio parahaemolyticus]
MSNVAISLSANTASYVQRLKDAKTETDRNLILMEKRIDKFARDVNNNFTSVDGSINAMLSGLTRMKGGGYVAAILALSVAFAAAASAVHELSVQSLEATKNLERYAEKANMATDEFLTMANVLKSVGLSMEQVGDIAKDMQDKLGDYITNGSGGFEDFFQIVGFTNERLAHMKTLTTEDMLTYLVSEMEKAGATSAQMSNALESVGNDLSYALPLLEKNAKGYKELSKRMKEVSKTATFSDEAKEEMNVLSASWESMWTNFGTVAANKLEGLYEGLNILIKKTNDWLLSIDKGDRVEKIRKQLSGAKGAGEYKIDFNTLTSDQIKKEVQALTAVWNELYDEIEKEKKSLNLDGMRDRRISDLTKLQHAVIDKMNAARKATEGGDSFGKWLNNINNDGDVNTKGGGNGTGTTTGVTDKQIAEQQAKVNAMFDKTTAQEIAKAKEAHNLRLMQIDKEKVSDEAKTALKFKAEKDLIDEITKIREAANARANQAELDSIDTKSIDGKLEAQELSYQMQMDALNARIRDEAIADDTAKALREKAELEHQRKLQEIRDNSRMAELEAREAFATTEAERRLISNQMELEDLELKYEAELIRLGENEEAKGALKIAYDAAVKEKLREQDEEAMMATAEMNSLVLQGFSDVFGQMESLAKEGSTAQKLIFAANKAMSIAQTAINMETNAVAAKTAVLTAGAGDPTAPARAEMAATLSRVKDSIAIGTMIGTTLGQFHSGTDEVDQTGSYVLKAGERVVQESANKDLTSYLKSNSKGSSGSNINAGLTIQGDTTISEAKLTAMMAKQRDQIARMVKLAQREDASLR